MVITAIHVSAARDVLEFVRAKRHFTTGILEERRELARLDPRRNPFLERTELAMFVARKEHELVGRIAGAVDHLSPDPATGFFGFFAAGDVETASGLLHAVSHWLGKRGKSYMVGPVGLHTTGEIGLEIGLRGNGTCHSALLEGAGLVKLKDFLAYRWDCRQPLPERIVRASERAWRIPGLRVRSVDWLRLRREAEIFAATYNAALAANWGFSPLTDREALAVLRQYGRLPRPVLFLVAEVRRQPAGILLALPPTDPEGPLRLALLAVVPAFRYKGIHALLATVALRTVREWACADVELSLVAEDNREVLCLIEGLPGSRPVSRYRVYSGRVEKGRS